MRNFGRTVPLPLEGAGAPLPVRRLISSSDVGLAFNSIFTNSLRTTTIIFFCPTEKINYLIGIQHCLRNSLSYKLHGLILSNLDSLMLVRGHPLVCHLRSCVAHRDAILWASFNIVGILLLLQPYCQFSTPQCIFPISTTGAFVLCSLTFLRV